MTVRFPTTVFVRMCLRTNVTVSNGWDYLFDSEPVDRYHSAEKCSLILLWPWPLTFWLQNAIISALFQEREGKRNKGRGRGTHRTNPSLLPVPLVPDTKNQNQLPPCRLVPKSVRTRSIASELESESRMGDRFQWRHYRGGADCPGCHHRGGRGDTRVKV